MKITIKLNYQIIVYDFQKLNSIVVFVILFLTQVKDTDSMSSLMLESKENYKNDS